MTTSAVAKMKYASLIRTGVFALAVMTFGAVSANNGNDFGAFSGLFHAELAHKRLAFVVLIAGALALGIALLIRRRMRALFVLVTVVFLACLALGAREFGQRYPYQGLFSPARYGDALSVLLGTDIRLGRYQPESLLQVELERVAVAAYPVTDVHWHILSQVPELTPERLVAAMDAAGIQRIVNLDGLPEDLKRSTAFTASYPDRFVHFVKPDIAAVVGDERGVEAGVADQVRWIEEAARRGAQGVKISKSLGTGQVTRDGKLLAIDDPRLGPIWDKAAQLGMPILIHTGDPEAFFHESNARNERYEEMIRSIAEVRYGKPPSREELFSQRERLLARHPQTNFIGAHLGMQEDDLAKAAALLDRYPNYYVDTAAVLHALGRQPFTARRFFVRYQDRILFGSDGGYGLVVQEPGWTPERLFRGYIEFFETSNEYVEYPIWGTHNQGRWRIYGLDLPAEVLAKIYQTNADRLIPARDSIARRLE